jgi:hypothetical protein
LVPLHQQAGRAVPHHLEQSERAIRRAMPFGQRPKRRPGLDRLQLLWVKAGLVGSRQMERVLSHAQSAGAKVVLIGCRRRVRATGSRRH